MTEDDFLGSLSDLKGKVAVVTGGAAGIGLECSIYLARKGATVYVASRNEKNSKKAIEEAIDRLANDGIDASKRLIFHHLDLMSIESSWDSAQALKTRIQSSATLKHPARLDIVVANAGSSMLPRCDLSIDGWERTFAINHLGHFSFITSLLPLIQSTTELSSLPSKADTRIVIVSSNAHRDATPLDYSAMRSADPKSTGCLSNFADLWRQYSNAKLANIYFATELDRRLSSNNIEGIYVNCCHPGAAPSTGLGSIPLGVHPPRGYIFGHIIEPLIRSIVKIFFASPLQDVAKTQTILAAGPIVRDQGIKGQYWNIRRKHIFGLGLGKYTGSGKKDVTNLARDEDEARKLWDVSERELRRVIGGDKVDIEGLEVTAYEEMKH
ncbi:putative short chain type [Phaeomoniella chlamydospora]|uniref:Putative short chain type n=1 Tax=Phaeomoniella chlamydospora TaxID=158046 RepID=A0A0G2HF56_PHACM|nr:putative short chain type [Phaeomoniella chlamydospora]